MGYWKIRRKGYLLKKVIEVVENNSKNRFEVLGSLVDEVVDKMEEDAMKERMGDDVMLVGKDKVGLDDEELQSVMDLEKIIDKVDKSLSTSNSLSVSYKRKEGKKNVELNGKGGMISQAFEAGNATKSNVSQ